MHNPRDDQAARPKVIAAGPSDAARVIDILMLAFAADELFDDVTRKLS